ncbi:glycosyltransferase [Arthrobacter sp. NEB 688]|uniref:glycosyltransferase n=1 Tax=Arthrobacter sp. NEB 688 TaxID=904039 RepID=UPI0015678DDB|nr:glycosyltransferase [Arthrobacter sp. NEB 688]QKE85313.1 glycosyltransferase [Arthrobacter sp. NEB 688]
MRSRLEELRGRRVLLAASTGGHLAQLVKLAPVLGVAPDSPWLTFDTPQSRDLLVDREVHYVPYIGPRDFLATAKAVPTASRLLRTVDGALSTGAALATAVLTPATARRMPAVYLESVSRVRGPSLTGRMVATNPRVGLYTQHPGWASSPWRLGPTVLSTYERTPTTRPDAPLRVLVTVGTIEPFRFDRLVDLVLGLVRRRPQTQVTWQLGASHREGLPGTASRYLPADEFASELRRADVVVSHAGVGTAMEILDAGRVPVLLPRLAHLEEHVDDHQQQIFDLLVGRDLAADASVVLRDPDAVEELARWRVGAGAAPSGTMAG